MAYAVKEIFYTLQGEGAQAGRPAVFLRFSGCNLWSGLSKDRDQGPGGCSRWCDTDFVGTDGSGGGKFRSAAELVAAVASHWPRSTGKRNAVDGSDVADGAVVGGAVVGGAVVGGATAGGALARGAGASGAMAGGAVSPFVVCTGGEPLLQLDEALVVAFNAAGWFVAVETNGTLEPPPGKLWLTVSPKAGAPLRLQHGDELKLVYPQEGVEPEVFANLSFSHFFLQPLDGPDVERNTARALEYCLSHPRWRLSLQTHKILNIR